MFSYQIPMVVGYNIIFSTISLYRADNTYMHAMNRTFEIICDLNLDLSGNFAYVEDLDIMTSIGLWMNELVQVY